MSAARRKPSGVTRRVGASGPSKLGDIWIGDVLDAWDRLAVDDEPGRVEVARALGFHYTPPVRLRDVPTTGTAPAAGPAAAVSSAVVHDAVAAELRSSPAAPSVEAGEPAQLVSLERATASNVEPAWMRVSEIVAEDTAAHRAFRPPLEPLFERRWTRALLGALAATRVPEGALDVPRVVDAITRLRPLEALPRRPVPTLRRGAQLLLDGGRSLAPLARDVEWLAREMTHVVGDDRCVALRFEDHPGRGVSDGRGVWQAWTPPPPDTPVIVVSDFGLTRGAARRDGASVEDWTAFARRVHAAGCPAIGVVPFRPARWPVALRHAFRLLSWTRAATVTRAGRVARGERA